MTRRRLARAGGVLLLIIPLLPLARIFGALDGAGSLVPPAEWLLGLAVFGTVAWLCALALGDGAPPPSRGFAILGSGGRGLFLAAGLLVLAGLLLLVSLVAFGGSPLHVDSVAQLFQAKIFAGGALAAPPPPGAGHFVTQNMVVGASGWYSQYPPGHAGLLSLGVMAGHPWIVPVVLSLGSAVFLFGFTRLVYGEGCARLTLLLAVLCPFFWFMGASFMNHVSALFFVSAFLYLFARWEDGGSGGWALAAGAALGAAALSRPLTALAVTVVFAAVGWSTASAAGGDLKRDRGRSGRLSTVETSSARRPITPLLTAGIGFGAVAGLYLLYNWAVTGDPLLPGYLQLWGESHGLGFHETPWGGEHTPWTGVRNELIDLSLLNLHLFEWPVPALLPVGAALVLGWLDQHWDLRLLLGFLALPTAYFFYWHRDAFLGPRFLYSSVVFALPLTARALMVAGRKLENTEFQFGTLFRPVRGDRLALSLVGLCVAYAVTYGIPQRFRAYDASRSDMKVDIRQRAARSGIEEGLIFVKVSWGNRILSRLRAQGVSAGMAIRAYRTTDHCDLHRLLVSASANQWSVDRLAAELERQMNVTDRLVETARLNGDPTLRLRSGRTLPPECREEIRYDRRGYTNYTPHLTANRPTLDGDLVVARDLRAEGNARLTRRYPGRPVYRFDGDALLRMGPGGGRADAREATGPTEGGGRPQLPRRGGVR